MELFAGEIKSEMCYLIAIHTGSWQWVINQWINREINAGKGLQLKSIFSPSCLNQD